LYEEIVSVSEEIGQHDSECSTSIVTRLLARCIHSAYNMYTIPHRRIQELKLRRGKVERRRHKPSRGAEGAKGRGKVWERGVPPPQRGIGLGKRQCPLPRNFF